MASVSEVVELFPCKESGGLDSLCEAQSELPWGFWEVEQGAVVFFGKLGGDGLGSLRLSSLDSSKQRGCLSSGFGWNALPCGKRLTDAV
jgi:hypothetical protein